MRCCKIAPRTARVVIAGLLGILFIPGDAFCADAGKPAVPTAATKLVDAAQQAELKGDSAKYYALLQEAVGLAPDYSLARWQLGQMQVDGEWLTVEEAQRRAAASPKQAEYRELRKAHGESPQGQLALARWCRKNDLVDESKFHWASVLAVAPDNEEALKALNVKWQGGRLLTKEQIAWQKERMRELKAVEKRWAPQIAKWRRAVTGNDSEKRSAALNEIRALRDLDAIYPLEAVTLGREAYQKKPPEECRLMTFAFLTALAQMPEQPATESLARHAVFSPTEGEVTAAIEKLKTRPMHDYVPVLLSGLSMPIESSFQVRTDAGGSVHYTHSLYREGAEADWAFEFQRSAMQHQRESRLFTHDVYTNRTTVTPSPEAAVFAARKAAVTSQYQSRFGSTAGATESQVQQLNEMTESLNSLIIFALTGATGQNFGDNPKLWWDWWRGQNEYYASNRPVERYYDTKRVDFDYGRNSYRTISTAPPPPPPPPRPPGSQSCFAKGTPVWTKSGRQPIETLELGDLVLAQNVNTGELTYKPVIARTVRPPSEILKLSFGGEALRTTRGHPLWVSGIGWRMAKEVGDGAILHGVTSSPRVESVAPDGQEEAYNLVVADFNTYFVGESGVLVHDNTPRRPTRATVPGLVAK